MPSWEDVRQLVSWWANRPKFRGLLEYNELISCGYIAFADASERYRGEGSFQSLLYMCFLNQVAEYTQHRNKTQSRDPIHNALSLDAPAGDDMDDITLADQIEDKGAAEDFRTAEREIYLDGLKKEISHALGALPEAWRSTLYKRYWWQFKYTEIAEQDGTTAQNVARLERAGLKALRYSPYARKLRTYLDDDIYSAGLKRSGLSAFRESGSRVENIALQMAAGRPLH